MSQRLEHYRDRIIGQKRVALADLKPHPSNWRLHSESQASAMDAVLENIGMVQTVVWNQKTGHVLDGHLRLELAARRGEKAMPVTVVELEPEEERAVLATFDPIGAMAGVDEQAFRALAAELDTSDIWLADLLSSTSMAIGVDLAVQEPRDDEDDVPSRAKVPVTKPGDLWMLGPHRLLCGDATVATDVERVLGGVKPLLMVTDPPYGVGLDPSWRDAAGLNTMGKTNSRHAQFMNKGKDDTEKRWDMAWQNTPCNVFYAWCGSSQLHALWGAFLDMGFEPRQILVWDKTVLTRTRTHYWYSHELCIYGVRRGCSAGWVGKPGQSSVWAIASPKHIMGGSDEQKEPHPAQKPVECMRRPMINNSSPGQAVYDPFVGSGTSIIAAETIGRSCLAIEIDPIYVDVAAKRWECFANGTAILDGDGRSFDEIACARAQAAA